MSYEARLIERYEYDEVKNFRKGIQLYVRTCRVITFPGTNFEVVISSRDEKTSLHGEKKLRSKLIKKIPVTLRIKRLLSKYADVDNTLKALSRDLNRADLKLSRLYCELEDLVEKHLESSGIRESL